MHRVRDLDPSCGHVQISSRGHVGRHVTRGRARRHTRGQVHCCTVPLFAVCLWSPAHKCHLKLVLFTKHHQWRECRELGFWETHCVHRGQAAVVVVDDVVVRLIWWQMTVHNSRPVQWPGHFFVSIYSKDRGLSTCTLFLRWILFLMLCLSRIRIFNNY